MLLAVFEGINFTAFFLKKIWDRKVDKNGLTFNQQICPKNVTRNIKIEIN